MKYCIFLGLLLSLFLLNARAGYQLPPRTDFTEINFSLIETELDKIVSDYDIQTAGIAIVRNGRVKWSRVYGELAPGIKANDATLINVASVTKVIVAETALALVGQGKLLLDEKISEHWIDPDIKNDPRHKQLTPRILLNHTTGFSNWRFNEDDGRLKFHANPGTTFGYSGEGMDYLVKFIENKLNASFESIVKNTIFRDASIKDAAMSPNKARFPNIAQALTKDGKFLGHYCRPNGWCQSEGVLSGADDLVISVIDLAKFVALISSKQSRENGLSNDRREIAIDWLKNNDFSVKNNHHNLIPKERGYGLGWEIYDYGEWQVLGHGGSDWSEFAHVYFYSDTGDGVAIALNGQPENNLRAMVAILKTIDPNSPVLADHQRSFDEMTKELDQRASIEPKLDATVIGEISNDELEKLILKADTDLFEHGFNQCNFDVWNARLAEDLEFYDDRSGLNSDREKEVTRFIKKCEASTSLTRKLVSSRINRLNNFGAVQRGVHRFYENDTYVGSGEFIHLWSILTGEWQVTRVISYNHKPAEK